MEIRHLRYFKAVAENLSFSLAAAQLKIAQPPLTQQIQALESELGVTLFDRKKRPIQLTLAGTFFLEETRSILMQLEQAVRKIQHIHEGDWGYLTIGIHNSVATALLPKVLTTFRTAFPQVTLELREVTIEQEIPLLKNQQLDVVFHRSPSLYENDPNLCFKPIMQESFMLVLPDDHPIAALPQISLEMLEHETLILPSLQGVPFYEQIITACQAAGFEPKIAREIKATGIVTLLSLVATRIGLTILPSHIQTLHRDGVVYRPISGLTLSRQTTVVWQKDNASPVLQNFLKVLQAEVLTAESMRVNTLL
jgi:DNA-binding transcriptional LysR family regulator